MDNKEIIQEAFFKKEDYSKRLAKKLPQYTPSDNRTHSVNPGFGGVSGGSMAVSDQDEVKKRLVGTFGASLGANSVRSLASKSIKSFPIIISDQVDPETSVTLKKLMEEQYAEYINLMISNQIVDLADFKSDGTNGNIAIQALDKISSADSTPRRNIAMKAAGGSLKADDVLGNFSLFNLIRQESHDISCGNKEIDALLEDAIIVPKEYTNKVTDLLMETINEATAIDLDPKSIDMDPSRISLNSYIKKTRFSDDNSADRVSAKDGFISSSIKGTVSGNADDYKKVGTADIILDTKKFNEAINVTLGEFLIDPTNQFIRDKFEKATFLLQSSLISGGEYISYLTERLGIPVSQKARRELVMQFKSTSVRVSGGAGYATTEDGEKLYGYITNADADRIASNRKVGSIVKDITHTRIKDILTVAGGAAAVGGAGALGAAIASGSFTGGSAAAAAIGSGALLAISASPVLVFALAGAAIGGGAVLIAKLIKFIKERKDRKINKESVIGWERVEALIDKLDENQMEITKKALEKKIAKDIELKKIEVKALGGLNTSRKAEDTFEENNSILRDNINGTITALDNYRKNYKSMLAESSLPDNGFDNKYYFKISEDAVAERMNFINEEIKNDKDLEASLLSEAVISSTTPIKLTKTYEYDTKSKPNILVTPAYSARSNYAYGNVDYDKRDLKDRKYNAPLIMTVSFRERFSDGTFSDNELTAVIGILGVINRVPSEEMEYILKSNSEGKTLKGIFSSTGTNNIADLIGLSKIKKDVENLPQSGEVWQNLEKNSNQILANKIAGKQTNNIANAHIVFAQKEIDDVKSETGIDYLKDKSLAVDLMKRYLASSIMVANDISEKLWIFDDIDSIGWEVIPYSAIRSKDTGDQLTSALIKLGRI